MKLFTPEQVIEKQINRLKYLIDQKKRNQLILQGELQSLEITLRNFEDCCSAETTADWGEY